MVRKQLLEVVFLILGGGALAAAGTICPAGSGADPFPHSPDNAATGCNVVVTVAVGGTITITVRDTEPYEESDDILVGVVNNNTTALSTLNLSGTGISGFDGDGICTFTFVGDSYCTASQMEGIDPGDYEGPTSTFTNFSSGNSVTVTFSPAVAASGGTTYFSLEGIPSSLTGATTGPTTPTTPVPPTLILALLAVASVGLLSLSRRFARL